MYIGPPISAGPIANTDLFCRFMAAWLAFEPDRIAQKCTRGMPRVFRVGVWRNEQTARTERVVKHDDVRTDHEEPPPEKKVSIHAQLLPRALAPQLRYIGQGRNNERSTLSIHNKGHTRVLLILGGAYLGWADKGARMDVDNLPSGVYALGAIEPLGGMAAVTRPVNVPSSVSLPH